MRSLMNASRQCLTNSGQCFGLCFSTFLPFLAVMMLAHLAVHLREQFPAKTLVTQIPPAPDGFPIAARLLGDACLIRDAGLLGSAAARPRTVVFGEDAYPDLWTKAAALLQSIVQSHPLVDGNKRLGWLATATFLELNGIPASSASNDDVYALVMDCAAGDLDIEQIAVRLQGLF